jgi:hypothetical protein
MVFIHILNHDIDSIIIYLFCVSDKRAVLHIDILIYLLIYWYVYGSTVSVLSSHY